jgi:hypothetical protein
MPRSAAIEVALQAAKRSEYASFRVLSLLTTSEPADVDISAAHEALVESLLAHVAFADAARVLLRLTVRPAHPLYGAMKTFKSGTGSGQSPDL